jgi:hypothetical protein
MSQPFQRFQTTKLRLLNHVVFVVDDSGSMSGLRNEVSKVFDNQIAELQRLDAETGQETHVSVYIFGGTVKCTMYDTDVMRIKPGSLFAGYHDGGMTALVAATLIAIEELAQTAQLHGDHAFLMFVLTDGEENHSDAVRRHKGVTLTQELSEKITNLPENWTIAGLVPDIMCKTRLVRSCGFPTGNVMVWDVSREGLKKAEGEIRGATQTFYDSRASGVRSTTGLFANNVTQAQVDASNLKPIDPDQFMIVPVALASTSSLAYVIPKKSITRKNPNGIKNVEIMPFIEETGRKYVAGNAYYELVKSERWSDEKDIAIVHRVTKKVYRGREAKALVVAPGATRIKPQPVKGGEYDIFPQSTSVNRHLPLGSRVLLFK